jgi:RNA polymerase sigma factor (TIGR02999 family)
MRAYKLRPWVSRQNNFDHETEQVPTKTFVEFSIDMEIEKFDNYMEDMFRHALAGFLRIAPDRVRVISKKKGSVKLVVELPEGSAEKLLAEFEQKPVMLAASFPLFDIERIERSSPLTDPTAMGPVITTTVQSGHSSAGNYQVTGQYRHELMPLLDSWSGGDAEALVKLVPLVYEDLRFMAGRLLKRERYSPEQLGPTDLVHEVYLRLADQKPKRVQWSNQSQFFAFAASLMRRILVDFVRTQQAMKRGDSAVTLPLSEAIQIPGAESIDVTALDDALSRLAQLDSRQSQIVEMRFLLGLSLEEIAEVMSISVTSVKRDWMTARHWLARELEDK